MTTGKLPSIAIPLTYAGQLWLVNDSRHKMFAPTAESFTCGFCKQHYAEGTSRYSQLNAESPDGKTASFTFCAPCVNEAIAAFPDMPTWAERAIVARIERDGTKAD